MYQKVTYKKVTYTLRLIRKFFTQKELLSLVTSNFYSILYYNSEIWHLSTLHSNVKQILLSASAKALRVCSKSFDNYISFNALHKKFKRATPNEYMKYRLAISLFKLYNSDFNSIEFVLLNSNQILTGRQTHFNSLKSNQLRVGINSLSNRFNVLNNMIPLTWLNLSLGSFKIKCKQLFLVN